MKDNGNSHWALEPDPVWIVKEDVIEPSPFFLKWWRDVSMQKFGNPDRWIDVAVELGYVRKDYDPVFKREVYEPEGFDYDPTVLRNSLGIPQDMPIIRQKQTGQEAYEHMIDKLTSKDGGTDVR